MYEELQGKGFTIIAIALDSGGNDAARPWIEAAKPTYPCLVDRDHQVANAYGILNVPSAVWIDESGRIVRPAEPAGATETFHSRDPVTGQVPPELRAEADRRRAHYYHALRDWVDKGSESVYALSEEEVMRRIRPPSEERATATAHFQLGVYLHEQGRTAEAQRFFADAVRLWPEGWTFLRQSWNFNPSPQNVPPLQRLDEALRRPGVKHFHEPMDMPGMERPT